MWFFNKINIKIRDRMDLANNAFNELTYYKAVEMPNVGTLYAIGPLQVAIIKKGYFDHINK